MSDRPISPEPVPDLRDVPAYWREAERGPCPPEAAGGAGAALMVAVARASPWSPGSPLPTPSFTWGFLSRSLCALVCGPVMGLVFGFVEDILGFILHPTGEFFPGYTLSTMAGVLVYALCFFRRRITVVRLIAANLLVNLLVNAAMGSIWSTMVRGGVYWAGLSPVWPKIW